MRLTERIQTSADVFRNQAELINQILAEPDSRLADHRQQFQFKELTNATAHTLDTLQDLLNLSQHSGPNLTLSQLADRLEQQPPEAPVYFDTGDTPGHYIHAYRGSSSHAALVGYGPDQPQAPPSAGKLAREARSAPQMPHTAYKGGEVRLYGHSPFWHAEHWQSHGRPVVDVRLGEQGRVILATAEPEPTY